MEYPLLALPGIHCWRRVHAHRVAYLVDAEAYFTAFTEAAQRAQSSLILLGWDIDSRTRLIHDDKQHAFPLTLGRFLNHLLRKKRHLRIYVLNWDFSIIFAFERQFLPKLQPDWSGHPRLQYRLDDQHPSGASHHQKIVVIDDTVAFVGGLDITGSRWDTPEHRAHDPRRLSVRGQPYGPFHDAQMLVDGDAAAALGELARERWRRATGQTLPPAHRSPDPWPTKVQPHIKNVHVAIARTEPQWNGHAPIYEVEALHLHTISAARYSLYIECQYLTSTKIARALSARLREKYSPDIVIIAPNRCSGWLEERTMGVLRARILRQLREADHHRHLFIYYPRVPNLGDGYINIHSKVVIADDNILLLGSANLSNRSMRLDTECVLALEAAGSMRIQKTIARFRAQLLGEHLGVTPEQFMATLEQKSSLSRAIEALRHGERTLEPLSGEVPEWVEQLIPAAAIIDPEHPLELSHVIHELVPQPLLTPPPPRKISKLSQFLWATMIIYILWRWTPLHHLLNYSHIVGWIKQLLD